MTHSLKNLEQMINNVNKTLQSRAEFVVKHSICAQSSQSATVLKASWSLLQKSKIHFLW